MMTIFLKAFKAMIDHSPVLGFQMSLNIVLTFIIKKCIVERFSRPHQQSEKMALHT